MTNFDNEMRELRDIVRMLNPTGKNGFEGLMAAVLTDIAKISFGLAKSGPQGGKDGQSALNSGAISFEGKLYDEQVSKNEVLSKIAEVAASDGGDADLWILGSTGTVSTQDVKLVSALGEKLAIMTLILDWSIVGLPSFATLLAMAPETTGSFLWSRTGVNEQRHFSKARFRSASSTVRRPSASSMPP